MKKIKLIYYSLILILLWSITILIIINNALKYRNKEVVKDEMTSARIAFEKDILYHGWEAIVDSIYVPVKNNSYFRNSKNMNVVTTHGDTLTLINPKIMLPKAYDFKKNKFDLPSSHLVSLTPINPADSPDNMERKAFLSFKEGSTVYCKKDSIDGKVYLRYIKPFKTEQSCLQCHAQQGYKLGDAVGALDVYMPIDELENDYSVESKRIIHSFGFIWLLGVVVILLIINRLRKSLKEISIANETIQKQNLELSLNNKELTVLSEKLNKNLDEIHVLNSNLEKQNRELDELNATKDKLFSIIAQDLKDPFNTLLNLSEILQNNPDGIDPNKLKKIADLMNSSSKQAYSLLQNLLEWSKIQTGTLVSSPVKVIPSDLIKIVINIYEPLANSKNISITSKIHCKSLIFADLDMIRTVLSNLVSNAIKFTNRGGSVSVSTDHFNEYVIFTVKDSGIGIKNDMIDQLFKIDSKLSKDGTENEKGTGLGLILCKEFVEKNNGKIWVESKLGEGSEFKFTVPKYKNKEDIEV